MQTVYKNICSSSLHIFCTWLVHEMKIGTKLVKFKTLTHVTIITFLLSHPYIKGDSKQSEQLCEFFLCISLKPDNIWKSNMAKNIFHGTVLQISSLITINVTKSMYSKPLLVIKGNSFWIHNLNIFKSNKQLALHVLISFKLLFKVQLPSLSALINIDI
jgi:hypothetical protein